MKRKAHSRILLLIKFLNIVLMTGLFSLCWFLYYARDLGVDLYARRNWYIIALYLVSFIFLGKIYGVFSLSLTSVSEMVCNQAISLLVLQGGMFAGLSLLYRRVLAPLPMLVTFALQLAAAMIWSMLANKWYFATFPPKTTAVIYDGKRGQDALTGGRGVGKLFQIQSAISVEACLEDIDCLDGVETVFLSGVHSHERNMILKYCIENGIELYIEPGVGDVIMGGATQKHLFHRMILHVERCRPSPVYLFIKRVFDICFSVFALAALLPVFLVIAIAIKAVDGGPVLYKQERLTKDGKHFMIHKFRSMCVDAEKDGIARLSTGASDGRVTPVGRVIRRWRLDETPQFFDVLLGNLSVVGPRPERPQLAERYKQELPEFPLRLQVKAGLTGYAQVYGQYKSTPYDKLQMDLMYIAHQGVLTDLKICFATVKALFLPESTEGVEVGRTILATHDSNTERI